MIRERHVPLLCGSCQHPMSCQENTCWRCGATVRRSRSRLGEGSSRHRRTRTRTGPDRSRRAALRRGSARRRPVAVPPHENGRAGPVPTWAADYARRQRERAESRARAKRSARALAAAIAAGEADYRGLRRRLDRYGARLAAVRVRLVEEHQPALGRP